MTYVNDVYAKTKKGGKMTDAEKAKVVMGVLFAVNVGMTVLCAQYVNSLGIPLVVLILAQVVLYLFVCLQLFRFMVYREQDRDMDETDLFAPYYKIRPNVVRVKSPVAEYDLFEVENNSYFAAMCLKFGMNNEQRAEQTEQFLTKAQDMAAERGLRYRFVVMNENFVESEEASRMLRKANAVGEPLLRATQLAVYNEVLNFAERRGSALCIYMMVYASSAYNKDDLVDVITQVVSHFRKVQESTAIRELEFLGGGKLLEMFKRFYAMAAIDLSLSKIQYNAVNSDILKSILVYRIVSADGRVFKNEVFDKIGGKVTWKK
ncbi:hypothetical protein AGMMS49975_15280 [Clostridia bacterium]|nr:hypothetical protein AGMMS49975_15280 [Clostridia bacterium]